MSKCATEYYKSIPDIRFFPSETVKCIYLRLNKYTYTLSLLNDEIFLFLFR